MPKEDYQLKRRAQKQIDQAYKDGKKARFWKGNLWIDSKLVVINR